MSDDFVTRKEFNDFKSRVEPMFEDWRRHAGDGSEGGRRREAEDRREARSLIEEGDLDGAGKLLGVDRAHAGQEGDESYGRRLLAALVGAEAADAADPRPSEAAPENEKAPEDDGSTGGSEGDGGEGAEGQTQA